VIYLKKYELEKPVHVSVFGWRAGFYLQVRWVHKLFPMSVIKVLVKGNSSPLWAVVMCDSHNFISCCGTVVVGRENLIATFTKLVVTESLLNIYYIMICCGGGFGERHLFWGD